MTMNTSINRNREQFLTLLKGEKFPKGIIDAFAGVRQEWFFDQALQEKFYTGEPLPLGMGEFGDAPMDMARMIRRLGPQKKWRLLEVGTGSGYSTALLSGLVKEIVTVEWNEKLASLAKMNLKGAKIDNVRVFQGDGTLFDEGLGLFDGIIIFAALRKRPLSLTRQLKRGARISFPMGNPSQQQITVMINEPPDNLEEEGDLFTTSFHEFCVFPPVRGRYGWDQVAHSSFSE
ncbi:MAG TPA: protein-L-isoaspartate O-methyltransferase [Spirochaetes bacterium]|nr:protein-L-isoaspartate O-methyltransferase [Spirochaetota bacterium]